MKWNRSEINRLLPILEQVSFDLAPVDGKQILVLCSGTGEVVFWLAEMMEQGKVTGLDLDTESLELSRHTLREMGLGQVAEFLPAEMDHIPFPDACFDALVSEFIVYPTLTPTKIGQPEMARVLKPGGKMLLTDVIVTRALPSPLRQQLAAIGLDYLCDGTIQSFRHWMSAAGLINIQIQDLTPTFRKVWEDRWAADFSATHEEAYTRLLEDHQFGLGRAIFYIYVRGELPPGDSQG